MLAPIHIDFMIACHTSGNPEKEAGHACWNSSAGLETRKWLRENDLIDDDNQSTDRGKAWIEFICATPLPITKWVRPDEHRGAPRASAN